jgi:hypothetical protein
MVPGLGSLVVGVDGVVVVVEVDVVDVVVWVVDDLVSLWQPARAAAVPARAWRSARRVREGITNALFYNIVKLAPVFSTESRSFHQIANSGLKSRFISGVIC